jgi:hypothetical protein
MRNERLRQISKELQRHRFFCRRAETLPENRMLLGLEDVEQVDANRAAETDGSSPADRQVSRPTSARSTGERCQRICRARKYLHQTTRISVVLKSSDRISELTPLSQAWEFLRFYPILPLQAKISDYAAFGGETHYPFGSLLAAVP